MRVLAIFPLLCLMAAFILSMLLLFAGSKPDFLEQYDLVTLNTSRIGQVNLQDTLNKLNLPSEVTDTINKLNITGEADKFQGIVQTVARALNIHDFYSMHLLDYCEGYYTPSTIDNATVHPTRNVTACANTTTTFTFNITQILQQELRAGTTLAQLDWPQDIQNAIDALNYATRAMFVMYCIGIGLTGIAMIAALLGVFANGVLHAWLNGALDIFAFLMIGVASAIATAIGTLVSNAVDQYGKPIGIAAYRGTGFLVITWVATALVLLATFTWCFDCCAGRRRQRTYKV